MLLEVTWFRIAVIVIVALTIVLGIFNAIYFNQIRNKEEVSEGTATTLLWLNIIMIILYALLLIWTIISLIMTMGREEKRVVYQKARTNGTVVHHTKPKEAVVYHEHPQGTTVVRHKNPEEAVVRHKSPTTLQSVSYTKDMSQIPLREPTTVLKPSSNLLSVNKSQMISY